ncbi:MAG TPA: transcription antitermination factor NusB [Bryobacteraceae bacterium]|nr:transcription antitermination factor NusB [Bryobacteraceae bacterium]
MISPARQVAFDVLRRVEDGAYASDLLLGASIRLESRNAGLAAEIVFGTLRFQVQLDYLMEYYAGRSGLRLDAEVRIALRMGIYQLRYLERIPRHAAVGESVELVKRARKRSAAGLVNALLRKVTRDPVVWPDRAIRLSQPEWLLRSWERQFGGEAAERIAEAFLRPPETFVRISGPVPDGQELEPAEIPGGYRVAGATPPGARIQDIGSQSIVPLLDLKPGLKLLDLCAAPGNKTAQALESGAQVIASDIHASRLRALDGMDCERLVLDAAQPLPFRDRFPRILVDAPCSGTGTLGRNPEIKWRLSPQRVAELGRLQAAILRNALSALASGGVLVYSTCSLEREENEAVIEEVLGSSPVRLHRRIPGVQPGDGFFAAVITSN